MRHVRFRKLWYNDKMKSIDKKLREKLKIAAGSLLLFLSLLLIWQVYIPKALAPSQVVFYDVKKGMGSSDIAKELKEKGIIKSSAFFRLYVLASFEHAKLQAGLYALSPSMSVASIADVLTSGNVAKNKIKINEGWDTQDAANYLEAQHIWNKDDFLVATEKDFGVAFSFLKGRPKNAGLEGYLFPDTYYVPAGMTPDEFIKMALANFDKKLTPDLRTQITANKKTVFQIVTMASILEKEVRSLEDKKVVAGILWKRIANGMPLQVDATVNYVTGKNDPSASLADIKIDSRYNTYKYYGLPQGPISNPGMDSILAAIYPTKSDYWFYLSDKTGKTIFSKTYTDHRVAMTKYLN